MSERFDLAAVIGAEALARLSELAGGLELYVPGRPPMRGALGALDGAAQAALAAAAGGSIVYVPRPAARERAARDAAMRAEAAGGASRRQLACRYGLSTRQVRRILTARSKGSET